MNPDVYNGSTWYHSSFFFKLFLSLSLYILYFQSLMHSWFPHLSDCFWVEIVHRKVKWVIINKIIEHEFSRLGWPFLWGKPKLEFKFSDALVIWGFAFWGVISLLREDVMLRSTASTLWASFWSQECHGQNQEEVSVSWFRIIDTDSLIRSIRKLQD